MNELEKIVTISIKLSDTQECMIEGIRHCRHALIIRHKKEGACATEELNSHKLHMNVFCNRCTSIFGRKIFTNHFHLIASNHVHGCMVEWVNLYRYSQQGWEYLKHLLK